MRRVILTSAMMLLIAGCVAETSRTDTVASKAPAASRGPDLSSPEATLAGYFDSLRAGETNGVRQRYIGGGFKVKRPNPIVSYEITKKTVAGHAELDEWSGVPEAEIGDVELNVRVTEIDHEYMISYWMREVDGKWMFYSHAAWDLP